MQRGPFEEAGFIQQQTDNDDGDKGSGGVPDDGSHRGNILQRHGPHR
jgi:hypothetical protein